MPYGTINTDLITTSDGVSSAGLYGFKNRIINGAMVIDQRNAGASVTPVSNAQYTIDRWLANLTVSSKFSVQTQTSVVPSGFSNALKITSLSAYSVSSSDYFAMTQAIEGFNTSDLAWGTASAATVTLSFRVYSSLTGTFGGSVANGAGNRSYPFTYTISAANTWTNINVTIPGDTSGTWATNNTAGIYVIFGLGVGATNSGTAGTWAGTFYYSATGATSVVGTNGATFYITGVQLEKGSTATSFDYRPYGTELALCQRYYEIIGSTIGSVLFQTYASASGTANQRSTVYYKVSKRVAPTASVVGTWTYSNASGLAVSTAGIDATRYDWNAAAAGICYVNNANSGSYLSFDSEL